MLKKFTFKLADAPIPFMEVEGIDETDARTKLDEAMKGLGAGFRILSVNEVKSVGLTDQSVDISD